MSRYDREDIEGLDLPDPDPTTSTYYIKDGVELDGNEYNGLLDPPKVCAKAIQHKDAKAITHYILCNDRNQMFDPKEWDSRYRRNNLWKFRRVDLSTFDLYVRFLKHSYRSLLSQAERGL